MAQFKILGDEPRKGQSLALGNFDGVHLGHQAVLNQAREHGAMAVVTFCPHPRRFFDENAERFELMNDATLKRVLRAHGAEQIYPIVFDKNLSQMTPEAFLDALCDIFEPAAITTGEDFRFGKSRAGDVTFLRQWGQENGIRVMTAPEVNHDGEKVSSTRIRAALRAGEPQLAAQLLGRPHLMNQIVTKGDQRGRDLGFPTANLYPTSVMLPKFGIYATRVTIHDGDMKGQYKGASSLGVRPSFGVNQPNFETYILDFDADIYGAEITVELIEYLRGEEKFDNIDALVEQMNRDVARCKDILNA